MSQQTGLHDEKAGKDSMQPSLKAARIAGALYLLLVVTSLLSFAYLGSLIVPGDATATANNILASETLVRIGILVGLAASIVFIFLARALYRLLSGVNKGYASLMVNLVLVSIPITFLGAAAQIAAVQIIHGANFLSVFNQNQLNALAMVFLNFSNQISAANSIFFGLWLFPFGILVYRSGFIPKIFGILLYINGAAYLANCFLYFVLPGIASAAAPVLIVFYLVGEPPMVGWLLIKGVRVRSVAANPVKEP
jgi:hypothetical protein